MMYCIYDGIQLFCFVLGFFEVFDGLALVGRQVFIFRRSFYVYIIVFFFRIFIEFKGFIICWENYGNILKLYLRDIGILFMFLDEE